MMGIKTVSGAMAMGLLLSGCGETGPFATRAADNPATDATAATALVERDVEAPEVFSVQEAGLWDGRPSLGGVWVAHPDVADPERVLMTNTSNGQTVVGALFRRERENPGPRLQISSDAAEALGMLAGQPSEITVVALRREEVAEPIMADAEPSANPDDLAGAELASASLDVPADVTTTALDSSADPLAAAAAAIDAAEAQPAVADTAAPAPIPAAVAGSSLSRPYIQVGIFSVETNAANTATAMRGVGIVPTVVPGNSSGNAFWRVIVGPATSESERDTLLETVRNQGFTDAYFVTD